MSYTSKKLTTILILTASVSLSACGAGERLANVGKAPELTPIENPVAQDGYKTVSMPMPAPKQASKEKNSLWASDRKTFFEDQRAQEVGDILTVMIDIQDKAELDNETERERTSSEDSGVTALMGLEADPQKYIPFLPDEFDPTNMIEAGSTSSSSGSGTIDREEKIELKLAALVTQVLPNGNMVIQGRQEVRVNFEKRVLELAGVIRPQDIGVDNTIAYEKIAEARISYGGKGQVTDMQQPRYGQQVFDVLMPF